MKTHCEGLLTKMESSQALKSMKNGKTPGSDVLTVEFYKLFWAKVQPFVLCSLNFAFEKGTLSIDQQNYNLSPKKGQNTLSFKELAPYLIAEHRLQNIGKNLSFSINSNTAFHYTYRSVRVHQRSLYWREYQDSSRYY